MDELAAEISREFGGPVALWDVATSGWVKAVGRASTDRPDPRVVANTSILMKPLPCPEVLFWSPQESVGPFWLVLSVVDDQGRDLRAFVGFADESGRGATEGWAPACPRRALRLWGRAVAAELAPPASDCPRGGPNSMTRGREAFLLDRLIRWLRISDAPERFQRLAVDGIREELGFEAVAWLPIPGRGTAMISQGPTEFTTESFRALIPPTMVEDVRIVRRPSQAPQVELVVVAVADAAVPAGWIVAVNPTSGAAPRPAALELMQLVALLIGSHQANARVYADLKELLFGVIRALTSAVDAKDEYTCGHSERVARIAARLGEALGMSPNRCGDLYLMGLLHDVGKIGVEDSVLKKPGRLTPEEFLAIQKHVEKGVAILKDLKKLSHLLPGVAHHHESFDGSGYPTGLAGSDIPLSARILAVADSYDAMSTNRPYRNQLSPEEIEAIFRKGSGQQWDPAVVDALFACRQEIEREVGRGRGTGISVVRAINDTLGRGLSVSGAKTMSARATDDPAALSGLGSAPR